MLSRSDEIRFFEAEKRIINTFQGDTDVMDYLCYLEDADLNLYDELRNLKSEIGNAEDELNSLECELAEVTDDCNALESENIDLRKKVWDLEQENFTLRASLQADRKAENKEIVNDVVAALLENDKYDDILRYRRWRQED